MKRIEFALCVAIVLSCIGCQSIRHPAFTDPDAPEHVPTEGQDHTSETSQPEMVDLID